LGCTLRAGATKRNEPKLAASSTRAAASFALAKVRLVDWKVRYVETSFIGC